MTVILDLFPCRKMRTGICVYASELHRALVETAPYGSRVVGLRGPVLVRKFGVMGKIYNLLLDLVWYQIAVPFIAWRVGAHIVHFTANAGSIFLPCSSIVTVHDTLFLDRRANTTWWYRAWTRAFWLSSITRATALVAVSQATAEKVRVNLGRTSKVIYNGPGNAVELLKQQSAHLATAPSRYLLYVGMIAPHKNLAVLAEALAQLSEDFADVHLVLAGGVGGNSKWGWRELEGVFDSLGVRQRILVTGPLDVKTLAAWYRGAMAVLLPSLDEGFGFTPLEALCLGIPVVVSDIPVMREVLGPHAQFAPAGDPTLWAKAISQVLTGNPKMTSDAAFPWKQYSWTHAALSVWQTYEGAVGTGHRGVYDV